MSTAGEEQDPQRERGDAALGSGLSWGSYGLLLGLSVGLFVFWSGALWQSQAHDSHFSRFAVSYFAVLPMAVLLLLIASRFSWARLFTAVATVWGIKLVITVPLYLAFASGGLMLGLDESRSAPLPSARTAEPSESADYQVAKPGFARGSIEGQLMVDPALGEGEALVYVERPPPGIATPARELTLTIADGRYDKAIYWIGTSDKVSIKNDDSVMHTVRMSGTGVARLNTPVPAGTQSGPFELTNQGLFLLGCDNHPDDKNEHANVLIVDHPYAVRAKPDGSFELRELPTGSLRVLALHAGKHGVAHAAMDVTIEADAALRIALRFSEKAGEQQPTEKKTQ